MPTAQEIMGPRPELQYTQDYFLYGLDFGTIAANGNATGNIQIQADSDFTWLASTYFAFSDGDPVQTVSDRLYPSITMQITDSGSGRQLFNIALPVTSFAGDGALPYPLTTPRVFKARSNVQFAVSNLAASATRLFFTLHGQKVFSFRG